ncbi:RHS repeat domain-containing protein [Chryseobacterium kwangjuense]|uniref:RHS repeat domain-containing protein n=1 Tax=Chryseobacterium kwangjuense TaxID=267125 RepID=A0ABW9K8U1_9FLAO
MKKLFGTVTTDYLDGFQYEDGTLKFFPTAEGYYNAETGKDVYNYTDHLGNTRLSYFKNGAGAEIIEESNYYPFGLKHEGYNVLAGNPAYKYKYNGKELQETGMYDYGARFYMPDLGRWGVIDELAEKFSRHSPYNYVVNDPINGIDPDGRDVIFLADSKAVPVAGHGAVIVGNEKDGWYYYSMNGTGEGSSPYGDSKNPDIGTPLGKGLSPKQAVLAANKVNRFEKHNYDKHVTVKTTKDEDEKIKAKASATSCALKIQSNWPILCKCNVRCS